jgi:tetratricopeptide (TPR) repeat protein
VTRDGTPADQAPSSSAGDVPTAPIEPGIEPAPRDAGVVQDLAPGRLVAGRYRVVGVVGVGGMGIVYRAQDEQLDLPVALKVLRPEHASDPRFLERFRRELILARQVSHRNVVRIHDLGQDGDLHFLTMDLVEGTSVRELLETGGALPLERAVPIVKQIARALAGAELQGVVHRDLKPDNILLDGDGNAYITDFGIARSLGGRALTRTGMVIGTPNYLSPEQARGEEVDTRSDLYALGVIFFEMLVDGLPFRGGSDSEVLAQRLAAPPDLERLAVVAPPKAVAIVRKLLERDRERRYQNAPELLADLDELAPDARTKGTPARRLPAWARPAAALAAGVLVLGALGLAAWRLRQRDAVAADTGASAKGALAAPLSHAIAVLPFVDETGSDDLAWTGRAAAEMLSRELAASPGLQVVDSLRVFRTLEDLGLTSAGLASGQAGSLAELLDADRLVVGRVRAVGGGLQLEADLVAAELGSQAGRAGAAAASPSDLPAAVHQLARRLAEALAVPAVETAAQRTVHPAAMAAYDRGLDSLTRGDAVGAAPALATATETDPTFTAAWLRLADAYQALGRDSEAMTTLERAAATVPAGSPRLAAEVGVRRAMFSGDPEMAERALLELMERYPNDGELLVSLGTVQGEAGKLVEARRTLSRVVAADPKHPRAWYLLAKYAIQAGEARKAVDDYLVHALVIQNQLENEQGRADVLNALGVGYEQLGQVDAAADNYGKAADLRRRIGDRRGYATTLRNLARLLAVRGQPDEAAARLAEARALLEEVGDRRGLADVLNERGVLEEERGRYRAALDDYRAALEMREDLGDSRALAESYNNVGFAYYLLGEHDNAMVYWRQALELFGESGDRQGVVLAQQSIGTLQLAQGKWEEAARLLLDSLEASRELKMPDTTAVSLGHLGRLAHLQGRYPAALDSYRQALALVGELADRRGLIEFTLFEADTLLAVGDRAGADERLTRAASWLDEADNDEQRARLLGLQGRSELLGGEIAAARETFGRAVVAAEASHNPAALIEAKLGVALGQGTAGDRVGAARAFGEVAADARRLGEVPLRLEIAAALARCELERDRAAEAAAAAREGLTLIPPGTPWGGSWRLHGILAEAAARSGDQPTAIAARERAAAELERLRRQLAGPQRESFDALPEVRAVDRLASLGDR